MSRLLEKLLNDSFYFIFAKCLFVRSVFNVWKTWKSFDTRSVSQGGWIRCWQMKMAMKPVLYSSVSQLCTLASVASQVQLFTIKAFLYLFTIANTLLGQRMPCLSKFSAMTICMILLVRHQITVQLLHKTKFLITSLV